MKNFEEYGKKVWEAIQSHPFGSITKRELELILLHAALDSDFVDSEPANLASVFCISLTRSHAYLNDLALRKPQLSDRDGVIKLIEILSECEVINDQSYLSVPLRDAVLRIWLEQKVSQLNLNLGDVVRRDLVKLTPSGLAKIIGSSEGLITPYQALKAIPNELKDVLWVKEAKKNWDKSVKWPEAINLIGTTVSTANSLLPLFIKVCGN